MDEEVLLEIAKPIIFDHLVTFASAFVGNLTPEQVIKMMREGLDEMEKEMTNGRHE